MLRGAPLSPLAAAVMGICVTLLGATYTAHVSHVAAQGGWLPPLDLSQSGGETSRGPRLALAQNGDLQVIWMQPEPGGVTFTVHHASSSDRGSNWTYSVPLAPPESDRYSAAMDVDQSGTVHAVWVEGTSLEELWYAQLSGASQGERHMIAHTAYEIWAPDVVVTSGVAHTVWYDYGPTGGQFDVFYSRSESGESWSPATTTVETAACSSRNPRLAADAAGDLHVVWEENTSPPQIYYISGTVGPEETVWSMPITLSEGLPVTTTTPDIAVGSDNTVHVVFGANAESQQDVQDIYYASFPVTDPGVVSATLIWGSRVTVSHQLPRFAFPTVALRGSKQVHVAWNGWKAGDDWDSNRIYYAVSEDGGASWSQPVPVSPRDGWPDGFPSLAADAEFVHVVWQEKVSGIDQDIYYSRRFPVRILLPLGLKAY